VLEIGPGLGAITKPLLERGLDLTCVELDRGLAAEILSWPEAREGRLKVICSSILDVDLRTLPAGGDSFRADGNGPCAPSPPVVVCGNLPYNLSTPILFWFMDQAERAGRGIFMLQREMAARLSAGPGSRDYGRLSVAVGLWYEVAVLRNVPPQAFSPRPRVSSSLVRLRLRGGAPSSGTRKALSDLTQAAFLARRKTIFNNLSARYGKEVSAAALGALGVAPTARPETLAPEIFLTLSRLLETGDGAGPERPAGAPGQAVR
jgi:16S rRNA (adenine1518-N6/adenine1519-N6)-dimethyltransferase